MLCGLQFVANGVCPVEYFKWFPFEPVLITRFAAVQFQQSIVDTGVQLAIVDIFVDVCFLR
jgi:hypothetical protein